MTGSRPIRRFLLASQLGMFIYIYLYIIYNTNLGFNVAVWFGKGSRVALEGVEREQGSSSPYSPSAT